MEDWHLLVVVIILMFLFGQSVSSVVVVSALLILSYWLAGGKIGSGERISMEGAFAMESARSH